MLDNSEKNNQSFLYNKVLSGKPAMIARFGANEIKAVLYPRFPSLLKFFLKKLIFRRMFTGAGFFPSNEENIVKFSKIMIDDIKIIDVLGSWRLEEFFLRKELKNTNKIKLQNLEPYFYGNPWSKALEDKKILVIHPFAESIIEQYKKKDLLFTNQYILPNFKLDVIKAVQSVSGEKNPFENWFQALEFMKNQVLKKDFDIALIGCGAYGFPLAAHVKRIGKQAIHLGGSLQILFGIKGKRWDNHPVISKLYNEHWIRPRVEDKPSKAHLVEDACYW